MREWEVVSIRLADPINEALRSELIRLGWTPPAVQQNTVYYELGTESGQEYIRCKACDLKSFHPEDIKHRYCGNCCKFHGQ